MVDEIKDLLYEALEAFEQGGAEGLHQFYADHPAEAPELRARVRELRDAGLLEEADGMRVGVPAQIGEFQVISTLGEGGMGVVYLAEQPSLGRRVAIKLVRPEHLLFPGARERFRREVAVVARLAHPGVVPIYSVGEERGVPFFVMEAVDGATLAEVLRGLAGRRPDELTGADLLAAIRACRARRGAVAGSSASTELFAGSWPQVVIRVVLRIAEALAHAHERGVLHRDVKPGNVMLTEDGRVLLLDFGLASLHGTDRITRTGSLLGSVPYMAPEQLRGDACDAQSDVWSTGVTLYELLALRLPFPGRSDAEVRDSIARAHPHSPRVDHPALSWEMETVCLTALDRDRARRYASPAALADDLRAILELRPIAAKRPGPSRQLRRAVQKHPVRATVALFTAATAVLAPLAYAVVEHRSRIALEAANSETQRVNVALEGALTLVTTERNRADQQRERAELNFDEALAAVDTLLRRTVEARLVDMPRTATLRRQLLEDALAFYGRLGESSGDDPRAREARARALVRASQLRFELGQLEQTLAGTDEAIEALRALIPESQRPVDLRRDLARALELRGKALSRRGQTDAANAAIDAAVEEQRVLVDGYPGDARLRADLATFEVTQAHGFYEAGRMPEAREALERLGRRFASPESADLPDLWRLRAGVEDGLATLAVQTGEFAAAEAAYARAEGILREAQPSRGGELTLKSMLVKILENQAEVVQQQRDWPRARARIDAVLELLEVYAAEERDVPTWQSRLAAMLGTRADNRGKLGDPRGARADHERAIALLQDLTARYPDTLLHQRRLSLAYAMRASSLEALDDDAGAIADLERAVALMEQVLAKQPNDLQTSVNLGAASANLARLFLNNKDYARASAAAERALDLSRAHAAATSPGALSEVLGLAGEVARLSGDEARSHALLQEAFDVASAWLSGEPEHPGRAYAVASAGASLVWENAMSERFEAARAALDLALPAARVAAGSGAPFALHTCATLLVQRAYVDDREGDAAGAAACLVEARALGLDESNASEWLGATPTVLAVFERLK